MRCGRCDGLIAVGYDAVERFEYQYCLNCSHRPTQVMVRADGMAMGDQLRCVDCKVQPREVLRTAWRRGTTNENTRCKECRIAYNARKRQMDKQRAAQAQLK